MRNAELQIHSSINSTFELVVAITHQFPEADIILRVVTVISVNGFGKYMKDVVGV